jgi:hypothetical protein
MKTIKMSRFATDYQKTIVEDFKKHPEFEAQEFGYGLDGKKVYAICSDGILLIVKKKPEFEMATMGEIMKQFKTEKI